ncbi:hypothetical protein M378DRAFT_170260, partial [Amanita muscaria Koide BX008]
MVVATSPSQIDEIRLADDDTLSPLEAARDVLFYILFLSTITNCYPTKSLHANLTIGPEPFDNHLNIDAIEGPFTRNLGAKFA